MKNVKMSIMKCSKKIALLVEGEPILLLHFLAASFGTLSLQSEKVPTTLHLLVARKFTAVSGC